MTIRVTNVRRGKLRLAFGVHLTPGNNQIDAAVWARCRDHPVTAHYVQRGDVVEAAVAPGSPISSVTPLVKERRTHAKRNGDPGATRYENPETPILPLPLQEDGSPPPQAPTDTGVPDESDPTPAADGVPDLANMRAKDAITALLSITSVEDLEHLLQVEGRSTVSRAIQRRLTDLGV